jgi:bifunctional non-homologous end joining protein LigD
MGRMTKNNLRRFVIQRHERQGEEAHWDLMLETGEILETYRIGKSLEEWGDKPMEAVKIFDHPLKFLSYEGSVNKGKGTVKIADAGTYEVIDKTEDTRRIRFNGNVLKGEFELRQIEGARWEIRNIERRTSNIEH